MRALRKIGVFVFGVICALGCIAMLLTMADPNALAKLPAWAAFPVDIGGGIFFFIYVGYKAYPLLSSPLRRYDGEGSFWSSDGIKRMSGFTIALIVSEIVAFLAVVHLWSRRKMPRWTKVLWSVFLFAPFIGPLFYGFMTVNPEPHNEDGGDNNWG
jgi:hypothetical protein